MEFPWLKALGGAGACGTLFRSWGLGFPNLAPSLPRTSPQEPPPPLRGSPQFTGSRTMQGKPASSHWRSQQSEKRVFPGCGGDVRF